MHWKVFHYMSFKYFMCQQTKLWKTCGLGSNTMFGCFLVEIPKKPTCLINSELRAAFASPVMIKYISISLKNLCWPYLKRFLGRLPHGRSVVFDAIVTFIPLHWIARSSLMWRDEFNHEVNFVLHQAQVSLELMMFHRTSVVFIVNNCKFVHVVKCNIHC